VGHTRTGNINSDGKYYEGKTKFNKFGVGKLVKKIFKKSTLEIFLTKFPRKTSFYQNMKRKKSKDENINFSKKV